jgi:O-antigen ligase
MLRMAFFSTNRILEYVKMQIKNESLSFYFASVSVILIPVYTKFLPPFVILWAISRILETVSNHKDKDYQLPVPRKELILIALFLVLFFWEAVGLLYYENLSNGLNNVFSRLSLLIFPLLFVFPGRQIINRGNVLLRFFAGGTTLFIIFCLFYAAFRSVSFAGGQIIINTHPPEGHWFSYFYAPYFSVFQHPSYVAMFVILSIWIVLNTIFSESSKKLQKVLWIISGIILLTSIYFLSCRSGFLVLFISFPIYFLFKERSKRKFIYAVTILVFLLTGGFLIVRTNERVKIILEQISDGSFNEKVAGDSRILIWKSSINIIRNSPLIGVGIGDVRDELMKEYSKMGNEDLLLNRYNAHNQFLEVTLEGGLIGLAILVLILGYMTYYAISERNLLYGLFIVLIFIFFQFESVLYRFAGVSFFSLFSFLLIYNSLNKNNKLIDNQNQEV